ncbi:NifU family protein [bacterium]|nr:MAG: NifU family protein [bacterium]
MPEGEELRLQIEEALKEIRPSLQADGGDVELVNIDETERIVTVRLAGACGGCPSAGMTLKAGVEKTVKKYAPSIKSVIAE